MSTVSAAYALVARGRLDQLAPLLSADLDWSGIAGPDEQTPRCRGRATALAVIQRGMGAAAGAVSVREFVEHGDRVLAHVVRREQDASVTEQRQREVELLPRPARQAPRLTAIAEREPELAQHPAALADAVIA